MSQYKTGTANVTKSKQTVTGTGTAWLANVTPGDGFTIAGSGVPYTVASVETDTSLTLSAPYAGATASGQVYTVWRDFTTNYSIPELSQGDIETATIWTRAARIIDGSMAKVDNIALQGTVGVYGSTANGLAGTAAGDYFFVVDTANLVLYLNDAGVATLVGTYPLLEDIQADFDASLVELQAQQDAFQANHVRLSRSLSKSPDNGETLRLDFATNGYGIGSDFTGMDQAASLLDLVTFTRASEATYYDAQGILRTAAVDEPRRTYDPTTGESLGLLIEEQRTRLNTIAAAPTTPENVTVAETAHTISFFGTGTIDLTGAHVGQLVGTGAGDRVTLTFTPTAGTLTITPTGTVENLQLEEGGFETSVILGEGTQVTRSADNASVDDLTGWFNASSGTFYMECSTFDQSRWSGTEPTALYVGSPFSADSLDFRFQMSDQGVVLRGADGFGGAFIPYTGAMKCAASFDSESLKGSVNGSATVSVNAVGALAGSPSVIIGRSDWGRVLNGHIKNIRFIPRVLSNSEIETLTS